MSRVLSFCPWQGRVRLVHRDAAGNQLSAGDNNGSYTYQYDDLDRVTDVVDPFGLRLAFAYDEVGNRTQTADSLGGVTDSVYDANNQLVSRQFSSAGVSPVRIDQTFTARGELDTIARYSDLAGTDLVATSDYNYDPAGRILALVHRDAAGNLIADYAYSWDLAGRLLSQTDHGETKTYDYDATDQLTTDGPRSFAYDPNGNRTMTGYETAIGNRLSADGTWNYSYDDEGNLTKKINAASGLAWSYGYDHRNQLVHAEKRTSDGGPLELSADYKYDVHGLRIEKDVDWDGDGPAGPTVTKFALDGWDVYGDLDYAGSLTTRYVRTNIVDQVFARLESDGLAYWNYADHLLSIRDITDNYGVVKDTIAYDAFGNIIAETDPTYGGRYKYTGREYDVETDLQYNRARYYDAATGRWLSQDPLGFDAGDSNLYRYVNNQPTNATDPSGNWGLWDRFTSGLKRVGGWAYEVPATVVDVAALNGKIMVNAGASLLGRNQRVDYAPRSAAFQYLQTVPGIQERAKGGLQTIGGAVEMGVGVPSIKTGAGLFLIVNGWDNILAGLYRVITGEERDTLTSEFIERQLLLAGYPPQEAKKRATALEGAAGILAGIRTLNPSQSPCPPRGVPNQPAPAPAISPFHREMERLRGRLPGTNAPATTARQGHVIFGELDELGRPTGVRATITQQMIGTGSRAAQDILPPGFGGQGAGHARGHLLGNQLGGSGTEPLNLVTLFQNPANTPVMRGFEGQVRAAVEAGQIVDYWAIPVYQGSNLAPVGVTLRARGSGGFSLDVSIINRGK